MIYLFSRIMHKAIACFIHCTKTERTNAMNKYVKKLKSRIPAVFLLLGCFIVIAVSADYSGLSVRTSGGRITEKKTVILDAGHGGIDSGAVGVNGELEKNINLEIVKDLRDMLTISGFNVVLTRNADKSIHDSGVTGIRNQKISDMENRLEIVRGYKDALFFSVHQNKFTDAEYFGAQIFYNENNPDNMLLAQIMQDNFKVIQPGNNREIKLSGDELYLFKDTMIPAVLIECGFLSNEQDAKNLNSEEYQHKVAFMIYNGIIRYYQTVNGRTETDENSYAEVMNYDDKLKIYDDLK